MLKKTINILSGILLAQFIIAADLPIPYDFSFEETQTVEMSAWELNVGTPNANDQWKIGNYTSSDGKQSLYITSNGGNIAQYGDKQNVIIAYRKIKFPQNITSWTPYDLSFDWRGGGNSGSALYVYFGLEQFLNDDIEPQNKIGSILSYMSESDVPININKFLNKCQRLKVGDDRVTSLYNNNKWQTISLATSDNGDPPIAITSMTAAREYVLAFIWINRNTNANACDLGACIDNIQIGKALSAKPKNLSAEINCEDSTFHVVWESTLPQFELQYKFSSETEWKRKISIVPDADETSPYHRDVAMQYEGNYDFRVRAFQKDGSDPSIWTYSRNNIFWCPDNHCVNYVNLWGGDVECRSGHLAGIDPLTNLAIVDIDTVGIVNYGDNDFNTCHAVIFDKDTYDPYTLNSVDANGNPIKGGLLMVPDDVNAVIRLGRRTGNYGQESITYTLTVDSTQQLLLMRYAIVIAKANSGCQGGFQLQVLDSQNRLLDADCGEVDFTYSEELASEWNSTPGNDINSNGVIWKDWTTIGLHLNKYVGRTIKIRLLTHTCQNGATNHIGYAYFTIDCYAAELKSSSCGSNSNIEVNAPEGFSYTWLDENGDIVGTDRTLDALPTTATYTCMVCPLDEKWTSNTSAANLCCIELPIEMSPNFPYSDYTYERKPEDCRNWLYFHNKSHVITYKTEDEVVHNNGKKVDYVNWKFRSLKTNTEILGSEENPVYECLAEGDFVEVSLTSYINGGECDETKTDTIYVPSILTPDIDSFYVKCETDPPVWFAKKHINETGIYGDTLVNVAGCDSVILLHLTVNNTTGPVQVIDTVCSSDLPYQLNGYSYIQTGKSRQTINNYLGCDSIIDLDLTVIPKVVLDVDSIDEVLCGNDETFTINYGVLSGAFDSLVVAFDDEAQRVGFKNQVIYDNSLDHLDINYDKHKVGGQYVVTLTFYQHHSCGNIIYAIPFEVYYSSDILIEQKWGDVLALLKDNYEETNKFVAYQWYKNGQPIEGETKSYLYQTLEIGSEYTVQITRSDGVTTFVCAVTVATDRSEFQQTEFPTIVDKQMRSVPVKMHAAATIRLISIAGIVVDTQYMEQGWQMMNIPATEGMYILEAVFDDSTKKSQYLIVN